MRHREMPMDETTRDMVDTIVLDWLNKYPLEGPDRLSISNPEDKVAIEHWVSGVWGRITHQIKDSGLPYDNKILLNIASKSLHRELSEHKWYELVKHYLPK